MNSKIILMLALVAGLVTTFFFFQYMKQLDAQNQSIKNTVEIVVANQKIEKNTLITREMLSLARVPEGSMHPSMVTSIEASEGKIATALIEQNEPVMSHRLISTQEENTFVSRKVREGYRAVSVGVNINQTVSNLMEPDDEVDVIFSKEKQPNGNEKNVESMMLLEKARVLAVGRKLVTSEDTEEPYVEYSSVTLELRQEDALKLVNAAEQGNIHFILHKRPATFEEDNQK